ncbi:hypothetical protein V8G54_027176 [Vigna mungo]|uniref:Uncharacterized protein n=1 Tax=Vigna mungo TaxID=3915 RepID=A0AAQ3N1Q2_VIGMU
MQMEADPVATVDWRTYYSAANAYRKVHNIEKATAMLKKSEHLAKTKTPLRRRRRAYRCILTMHAHIGNKDEIYRLLNVSKMLIVNGVRLIRLRPVSKGFWMVTS